MNDVLVHNNWDPLEEIWLGDTYPETFYDDLKPEIRDNFCKVTEYTKEDLAKIEKKFQELGVIVRRPKFKSKEHYIEPKLNKLIKPPICPRDENAVIGNKLYYTDYYGGVWADVAKTYNPDNIQLQGEIPISGANIVKLGRDIIFDFDVQTHNREVEEVFMRPEEVYTTDPNNYFKFYHKFLNLAKDFTNDYRIHYSANGGHCDAMFMPVRPGLFLATNYWKDYDLIFPDWKKIFIHEPTYMREMKEKVDNNKLHNRIVLEAQYKWSADMFQHKKVFSKYVEKYCSTWIGNYTETYFEVNVVMVDEKNMIAVDTAGLHEPLFEMLNKEGINVHLLNWRPRSFWDGGIHCITLDIRRKGDKLDYFPNRGDNGITSILSTKFNNSKELFLKQYNEWLKRQKH